MSVYICVHVSVCMRVHVCVHVFGFPFAGFNIFTVSNDGEASPLKALFLLSKDQGAVPHPPYKVPGMGWDMA